MRLHVSPHTMPAPEEELIVTRAWRKETTRGVFKLFRVLIDAVRQHADWCDSRFGLSATELWALGELAQAPGMRALDLAKVMVLQRTAVEPLLLGLQAKQLLQIRPSEAGVRYTLTEAGIRVVLASGERWHGPLNGALANLPDASMEQLVNALRPLVESLSFREDRAALKPIADLFRSTHNH